LAEPQIAVRKATLMLDRAVCESLKQVCKSTGEVDTADAPFQAARGEIRPKWWLGVCWGDTSPVGWSVVRNEAGLITAHMTTKPLYDIDDSGSGRRRTSSASRGEQPEVPKGKVLIATRR